MRIDLHQHIWTESLLGALERRDRLPFVRRVNGLTTVHSARGCVGISLPAAAFDGADALDSIGPVLDYVTQMQTAWLTFAALGRREHPELTILFAMLAGGAPLQSERLVSRGGPAPDVRDPLTFYDTSSYGPNAVATMSELVGPEQLVYGSDRPVVEPHPTGLEPVTMLNGTRVVESLGVAA